MSPCGANSFIIMRNRAIEQGFILRSIRKARLPSTDGEPSGSIAWDVLTHFSKNIKLSYRSQYDHEPRLQWWIIGRWFVYPGLQTFLCGRGGGGHLKQSWVSRWRGRVPVGRHEDDHHATLTPGKPSFILLEARIIAAFNAR